jgi:hypothetical protein
MMPFNGTAARRWGDGRAGSGNNTRGGAKTGWRCVPRLFEPWSAGGGLQARLGFPGAARGLQPAALHGTGTVSPVKPPAPPRPLDQWGSPGGLPGV